MSSTECRICSETFQEPERVPKTLDCGHCFCLECLKSAQRRAALVQRDVECFECRAVVQKKPDELVTNFTLLSDASDCSRNSQFYCTKCEKVASFECEKNGHTFMSMAVFKAQQTKSSQEAAQAHKDVLESVLAKVVDIEAVIRKQLDKTMEEQDKMNGLLRRLSGIGAAGAGMAGVGLQDALREGRECAVGLPMLKRAQQLLRLESGSCKLSVQAEAGNGKAHGTATLDLAALAARRPDILAVTQYLLFLLASDGQLKPQHSQQQRPGSGGGGQRAQGHAQDGVGGAANGPRGNARGPHAGVRGAGVVVDLIADDGSLELEKSGIGDSAPDEKTAEKKTLLRSTKPVTNLSGLKCDKDPVFCTQLIQKHANTLEAVHLCRIKQEHVNLLGSLRSLKHLKLVGKDGWLTANLPPQPNCQLQSLYMTLPIPVQVLLWEAFASSLQNVTLRIEVQSCVDVHKTLRRPVMRTPNLRTLHLHRKSSDQHNAADCGRQMHDIRGVLPLGVRLTCNMCGTAGAAP